MRIAVAIHAVEPASFDSCALIRDWLCDHGIDQATLLVIPASDMHPFDDRSPALARWLSERVAAGDRVAQHGFQHRRLGHRDAHEFDGLSEEDTRRAVLAGRRVLHLAGVEPQGFVAPAYAYTEALSRTLAASHTWWASLRQVFSDHGRRIASVPALAFDADGRLGRAASPLTVRARAALAGELLRLDIHPQDLARPAHMGALEHVLRRSGGRTPVTYDDL